MDCCRTAGRAVALFSGATKLFVPTEHLVTARGGRWTADASVALVKTLGALEILAAAGLILPAALGIAPVLVPVKAVCWMLLMVGVISTHARRGESGFVGLTQFYFVLAAFIAWGRFGRWAFTGAPAAIHRFHHSRPSRRAA